MKLLKIGSIVNNKEIIGSVYCNDGADYEFIISVAGAMNKNFVEEQSIYPCDMSDVLWEKSLSKPKNKVIIL